MAQYPSPIEAATLVAGRVTAAGATTLGTPPANTWLRHLILTMEEDATLAVAAENTITVSVNGVPVFEDRIFVPATALASGGDLYKRDIEFQAATFNSGSGDLTVTLGTALATGGLMINAYFGD